MPRLLSSAWPAVRRPPARRSAPLLASLLRSSPPPYVLPPCFEGLNRTPETAPPRRPKVTRALAKTRRSPNAGSRAAFASPTEVARSPERLRCLSRAHRPVPLARCARADRRRVPLPNPGIRARMGTARRRSAPTSLRCTDGNRCTSSPPFPCRTSQSASAQRATPQRPAPIYTPRRSRCQTPHPIAQWATGVI